jgi:hypothetical protein
MFLGEKIGLAAFLLPWFEELGECAKCPISLHTSLLSLFELFIFNTLIRATFFLYYTLGFYYIVRIYWNV